MERNEISLHELKVYLALKAHKDKWQTNAEIAAECDGVQVRTVRAHTLKLVKAGLLDQAEVFPAHKFRLAEKADKRNGGYLQRLETAREVFGL